MGGVATTATFFVYIFEIRSNNQGMAPQYFEDKLLFLPPWLPQAVYKLFSEHVHSYLPQGGWVGVGSCFWTKNWSKIYFNLPPSLPLEVVSLQKKLDSTNSTAVYMAKQIPPAFYSTIFPESSACHQFW